MSTASETILALEKALEGVFHPAKEENALAQAMHERDARRYFTDAANPLAIRTLLDAHASALRDAARYRWLEQRFLGADFHWGADVESGEGGCQALVFTWPGGPVWSDLTMTLETALAALDDNTKGAAE